MTVAESVPGITSDNIKPCRIPDKARTILNRFISALRSPGGMIDYAENGKLN